MHRQWTGTCPGELKQDSIILQDEVQGSDKNESKST